MGQQGLRRSRAATVPIGVGGTQLARRPVCAFFARGQLLQFEEMGFGVAVALILDATLIRLVILPSTLSLLGQRSWYLPRWLDWLPHLQADPTPGTLLR
jgi:RND superfamily putative drug exporter